MNEGGREITGDRRDPKYSAGRGLEVGNVRLNLCGGTLMPTDKKRSDLI